jgi:hypothetical protein
MSSSTITSARPPAATDGHLPVTARATDRTVSEAVTQVLATYPGPRRQRTPLVVAVIPAWNEALCIADTIRALQHQTRPPHLIVVVANNCTDNTAASARAAGADVLEMPRTHDPR